MKTLLCLLLGLAITVRAADVPQPVLRYTFDAPFGFEEPNAVGSGYAAIIPRNSIQQSAPKREPGIFGNAVRPGLRQNIKSTFPAGKVFTVSFWMHPHQINAPDVFRLGDLVSIGIERSKPELVARVGDSALSATIELGQWTCVALTSSGEEIALYLNGQLAGRAAAILPEDPEDQLMTFAGITGAHHLFNGLIDEFRIYDEPLTAEHVARISDTEQALQTVPPVADAGPAHTVYLVPREGIRVPLNGRAGGGGVTGVNWSVVKQPDGSEVDLGDATALKAWARFTAPGDYDVQLTIDSPQGQSRDITRVVVFPPHPKRAPPKLYENPERPGTHITSYTNMGDDKTPAPYDLEFVEKHFPTGEPPLHLKGFAKDRFKAPPPPYVHPRIFFNPEDLPAMRERIRFTRAASSAYASVRRMYEMQTRGKGIPSDYFKPGDYFWDGEAGAGYCIGAFIALVEGDSELARKLIDGAVRIADAQLAALDNPKKTPGQHRDWQGWKHGILARYATSYVYDFLYPWMTREEQDKLRRVISRCTAGVHSIGMFTVPQAVARSNWTCWLTGDLMVNILAIEGEDGFDPVVYQEAANAMEKFSRYGFLPDGSSFEGMGKNSITGQNLVAMAKRGRYAIAYENIYNFYARFQLHVMQPYGNQFIADDLWGHSRFPGSPQDAAVMKYAYPNDPVIDFVYRNVVKGDAYTTPFFRTTYSYHSALNNCWFGEDWTGAKGWNAHAAQALEGLPLDAHFNYSNIATARSAWEKDAVYLYFLPRMLGGHNSPARGTFVFSALGRDWSLYPTGHNNKHTLQHSVITVNGKRVVANWARMIAYDSTPERMIAVADLRDVYANRARQDLALNDFRVIREPGPWNELPVWQLPHWLHGSRPTFAAAPAEEKSAQALAAFRAVSLVRADQTYAVIFDKMEIDGQPQQYRWQMVLPDELEGQAVVQGNEVMVTDPETGNRLLIRPVSSNTDFTVSLEPTQWAGAVVAFEAGVPAWNLAVALIPLRREEPIPVELPGLQELLSDMNRMMEPEQ